MRWLYATVAYASLQVVAPISSCGCPQPGTTSTQAVYDTSPGVHAYRVQTFADGRPVEDLDVDLVIGLGGAAEVDVEGLSVPVTLTLEGRLLPTPSAADEIPVALDLLSAAPRAGALAVGASRSWRMPTDGELDEDTLTVQSEVTMTLLSEVSGVATYDLEVRYRVVDNAALEQLRLVLSDQGVEDPGTSAMLDAALGWRLASFGEVAFDLVAGRLLVADVTAAGLPLEDLGRTALSVHDDAFSTLITLQ